MTLTIKDELIGYEDSQITYGTGNTTWNISIANGDATIATTDASHKCISFDLNKWEFNTYSPEKEPVQIYKQGQVDNHVFTIDKTGDKSNLSLQVGSLMSKKFYNDMEILNNNTPVEYGAIYCVDDFHDASNLDELLERFSDSDPGNFWTFENAFNPSAERGYLSHLRNVSCSPAKVDINGNADEDGEYYQFGVSFNNISQDDIDSFISILFYAHIDGFYFPINLATCVSVSSVASQYLRSIHPI